MKPRKNMDSAWEKLRSRSSISSTGCLEWGRGKDADGYGVMWWNGRHWRTHRLAFLCFEDIGPFQVLHKCDNPTCINPNHLFLGTPADNVKDRESKGRGSACVGGDVGSAVLSEKDVVSIRQAYRKHSKDKNMYSLGRLYKVSPTTISAIVTGRSWRHLPVPEVQSVWALDHEFCRLCKTTSREHKGRGLCEGCYCTSIRQLHKLAEIFGVDQLMRDALDAAKAELFYQPAQ